MIYVVILEWIYLENNVLAREQTAALTDLGKVPSDLSIKMLAVRALSEESALRRAIKSGWNDRPDPPTRATAIVVAPEMEGTSYLWHTYISLDTGGDHNANE